MSRLSRTSSLNTLRSSTLDIRRLRDFDQKKNNLILPCLLPDGLHIFRHELDVDWHKSSPVSESSVVVGLLVNVQTGDLKEVEV